MDRLELPCVKYILKKISSEEDVLLFGAFIYKLLKKQGLTDEQIGVEYISRTSTIDTCVDMLKVDGEKQDIDKLISIFRGSLSSVPSTCGSFCKTRLGNEYNDICKTCPLSPSSDNDFESEEYALLKYAATSAKNREDIKMMIGQLRCIFKTPVDIVGDIDYPHPIVVSMTNLLYGQINSSPSFFNQSEQIEQRLGSTAVSNHIFAYLCNKKPEVTKLIADYPQLPSVLMSDLISKVVDAQDYTEDEAGVAIDNIKKKRSRRKTPVPQKTVEGMSGDQLNLFSFIQTNYIDTATPEVNSTIESTAECDGGAISVDDAILDGNIPQNEGTEVVEGRNYDPICKENDAGHEPPVVESIQGIGPGTEIGDEELDTTRKNAYRDVYLQDMLGDPLSVPVVWDSFIESVVNYRDIETAIFTDIVKSRTLCFEILATRTGQTYIIVHHPGYPRCKVEVTDIPKTICALMSSKAVKKITWQPFYIYSIIKRAGYVVKNIHSILFAFYKGYPNRKFGGYENVLRLFCREVPIENATGSQLADRFISYLPMYVEIYRAQFSNKMLVDKRAEQYDLYRCEYLGLSYLRGNNLNDESVLFNIDINGRYVFSDKYVPQAINEGNMLSYGIVSTIPSNEKKLLIEFILMSMSLKQYFRKLNLQVITIKPDSFTLFCDDYSYDAVKTFIRMSFDRYALEHKYSDFNYFSDHRHVAPDMTKVSIRQQDMPTSLRNAQDILTTVYDSVSVDEDRVRIRKPSASQKQNQTFPKRKK